MKVYQNTGIGTIYIWMAPFMFAVYDSIYIWMAPANGGPGEWRLPRRMACPGEWPLNGLISAIPCIGSIYAIVDICFRLIRCFGEVKRVDAQPAIEAVLFHVFGCCERIEKRRDSSGVFPARYRDGAGAKIAVATKTPPSC